MSSACGWDGKFVPSPGWETRLTTDEKLWALDHNDKIRENCP